MRQPLLIVACLAGLLAAPTASFAEGTGVGDVPMYQFGTVDGKVITPKTYAGKLVVLDFWATWCGPCMAMADHMVELNHKYGPKGLQIIGLSLDKSVDKMVSVAQQKNFAWPHVCRAAPGSDDLSKFGVRGIPHTILISPQGQVLWRGHPKGLENEIIKAFKTNPPRLNKQGAGDADAADAMLYSVQSAVVNNSELTAALDKLAGLDPNTLEDAKVYRRARMLVQTIHRVRQAGDDRAKAVDAAFASHAKASQTLDYITRRVSPHMAAKGEAPAKQADAAAEKLEKIAASRMRYARVYMQAGKLMQAATMAIQVRSQYPQTDAATDAEQLLGQCRGHAEADEKLIETIDAHLAKTALADIRARKADGDFDNMRRLCEKLIASYPDSAEATEARQLLEAHPADAGETVEVAG